MHLGNWTWRMAYRKFYCFINSALETGIGEDVILVAGWVSSELPNRYYPMEH